MSRARASARCASCDYPLCVTDCVTCHECSSHFHIDCGQLVGFPYNELSVEPSRNRFRCNTCRLLPLPAAVESDSDTEDAMPSKQLECHLDPQGQEAHELRGSIHDLHDLCKDMLREINELKSVNLTLRCSVENLRHDNEEKGHAIEDLLRRLEALEKGGGAHSGWTADMDAVGARADDFERYSTPEPELAERGLFEVIPSNSSHQYPEEYSTDREEQDRLSDSTLVQKDDVTESEETLGESGVDRNALSGAVLEDTENPSASSYYQESDTREGTHDQYEVEAVSSQDERSLRANEALDEQRETKQRNVSDENANYNPDAEEQVEEQWQTLSKDLESQVTEMEDKLFKSIVSSAEGNLSNDEDTEDEEEYDSRARDRGLNRTKRDLAVLDEGYEPEVELPSQKHVEETHEDSDAVSETGEGEEDSIADHEDGEHYEGVEAVEGYDPKEGEKRLEEGGEGQLADAESRLEGDQEETTEGEARLESEQLREAETEGEWEAERQAEGLEEGEVQPAEPPLPIHTEEDLWDYLKETVTSVHPSTVEEFVQNLIGTLQHVPEEYLKPVIDANLKRVNSPSLTDGDHLTTPEYIEDGNLGPTESSVPTEAVAEGEEGATHSSEGVLEGTQEWAPSESEDTHEAPQPPPMPEDPEAEGYSVVEGAFLAAAFWICWAGVNVWGT